MSETTEQMLARYKELTTSALGLASEAPVLDARAHIVLDMARRYVSDAHYFESKGDLLRALAAFSYAHGWLDAGARLRFYHVTDERLFTVDTREY